MFTPIDRPFRPRHRRHEGHRQGHRGASSRSAGANVVDHRPRRGGRRGGGARPGRASAATVSFAEGDVTARADCEAVVAAAVERNGGLDVLCANAGIFPDCSARRHDRGRHRRRSSART